jgi:hypothetical protein
VVAGDAHAPVGLDADGMDELMVEQLQLPMMDVHTIGDISEVPHPWIGQDLVEDAGHRLDRLMVGGDPVADQPERVGKRLMTSMVMEMSYLRSRLSAE